MVQSRLMEFLVHIVFYFSDMRLTRGGEVCVFYKCSDELLLNSDRVLTFFGMLAKLISIGRLMLCNNKLMQLAVSFCSMASITNDI